ncbi:aminoglycoside phosphotransferase family protein [Micromonospora carbonacea]|uniref:aminoglycoside phosphotransferase family protein n=1 Tax=Micromonospora carbonacea TaxID=47853 RepID=UPI00371494DA
MSGAGADDVPELGPLPERIAVDVGQVRRLVAAQFPHWADLPVEPVAHGGWDNWTFHLGTTMSVRLPSAPEYAEAVAKEHRWLPVLAPRLPLPVPTPLAQGGPGEGYPYAWSVYRWLDGETARADRIGDPVRFALDLAGFVVALQGVDTADGPRPGRHNWYRGGTLRTYAGKADRAFTALDGRIDVGLAGEIWRRALDARWDGAERWFHGDLAQGNLLLDDGHLAAVIDFGTCGVGDPSCDLAVAWTLLTAEGREAFRERLAVDDAAWARGRGWALWKTLVSYANAPDESEAAATSRRTLDAIFSEYTEGDKSVRTCADQAPVVRTPPLP